MAKKHKIEVNNKSIPERFDRRLGYIMTSEECINKEILTELFKVFIPLRINYDGMGERILLLGYNKDFRVVKEAEKYPTYEATFLSKKGKIINISFKETPRDYDIYFI